MLPDVNIHNTNSQHTYHIYTLEHTLIY